MTGFCHLFFLIKNGVLLGGVRGGARLVQLSTPSHKGFYLRQTSYFGMYVTQLLYAYLLSQERILKRGVLSVQSY